MPSATLPYKVIVTNKSLGSTDGMGMASFDFLSLDDAESYAAQLRLSKVGSDYFNSYIYIWNGSGEVLTEYSPLDGDFTNVINTAVDASVSLPSNKVINAIDVLIKALKAGANTWAEFDAFYLFAVDSKDFALYNLKDSSVTATRVDSPTFTNNIGYNGNGEGSYLDLGYDSTAQFTQNDASMGVYSWDDMSISKFQRPLTKAGRTRLTTNSANANNRLNNGNIGSNAKELSASGTGLIGMTRNDADGFFGLDSSGVIASDENVIQSQAIQTGSEFTFQTHNFSDNFTQGRLGLAWIGGSLSATQWSEYVTAVNTYISSVS